MPQPPGGSTLSIFGDKRSKVGLESIGLTDVANEYWNLETAELYEQALLRGEGKLAKHGPLVVETGKHTGRSANDKFIVRDENTEKSVWWGDVNRHITTDNFAAIKAAFMEHAKGMDLFVQDLFAGADRDHQIQVRVISELAYHSLFIRTMLIRPEEARKTASFQNLPLLICQVLKQIRKTWAAVQKPLLRLTLLKN